VKEIKGIQMKEPKVPENRAYTVTLILLVGLAAFSTAMRDLNRLKEAVGTVQEFTGQLRGTDLAMLNVETISTDKSCPNDSSHLIEHAGESGFKDNNAPARGVEFEFGPVDEPEVGGRVELIASKKPHRNLPRLARVKHTERHVKDELSAKRRDINWPTRIQYRTSDRVVTLDLPMGLIREIKAEELDSELTPGFLLSLPVKPGRKPPQYKTDNKVMRELMLRKFERTNYSSRRAS
jgi:hypothetical protein